MKYLFLTLVLFFSLSSVANALTCPNKPAGANTSGATVALPLPLDFEEDLL